jgi:hypothetical protein
VCVCVRACVCGRKLQLQTHMAPYRRLHNVMQNTRTRPDFPCSVANKSSAFQHSSMNSDAIPVNTITDVFMFVSY